MPAPLGEIESGWPTEVGTDKGCVRASCTFSTSSSHVTGILCRVAEVLRLLRVVHQVLQDQVGCVGRIRQVAGEVVACEVGGLLRHSGFGVEQQAGLAARPINGGGGGGV